MEVLIELNDVSLVSQDYQILKNVSVRIPKGKFTVIMGPSGCGKSTLLKVLAGIIIPDSGKLYIEGQDFYSLSEKDALAIKKKNGFVFQDSALWSNKTIFENLSLPLTFHFPDMSQDQIKQKVNQALSYMNLSNSLFLRPAQLSIGEQKIVSFIRALITEPLVVFMDEPTLSVDIEIKNKLVTMIKKLKEKTCTIVAVIQDSKLTSMITDNLIILRSGAVLEQGSFQDVINSSNNEVKSILTEMINKPSSYDKDILDLLNE
jgi:phospholipid/cholesterol/gamma-HCH transport system ATP-binding protein